MKPTHDGGAAPSMVVLERLSTASDGQLIRYNEVTRPSGSFFTRVKPSASEPSMAASDDKDVKKGRTHQSLETPPGNARWPESAAPVMREPPQSSGRRVVVALRTYCRAS